MALGVTRDGLREVLGLWVADNEGAKFWLSVMNELRNRGVQDVLIAVVDGLKGFPEAITAAFPQATVQTCIVHLVRHSPNFCAWKDRKAQSSGKQSPGLFSDPPHTADLRRIYQAATADQAAVALDAFEAAWGDKYASVAPAWRRAWEEVTPFFAFPPAVQKIIYTTNAIESLNRMRRENSVPHCFLTLHITKVDQDPRFIPNRRSRHQANLSRHPQLRERRSDPSGNGLQRAINSISCSRSASTRDRGRTPHGPEAIHRVHDTPKPLTQNTFLCP